MKWSKPQITDVSIECREDVLAHCWSASTPAALEGTCPTEAPVACPNV